MLARDYGRQKNTAWDSVYGCSEHDYESETMQMKNDNKEMTAEQCRKESFVRNELRKLLLHIDPNIVSVEYTVEYGEEYVKIKWLFESGKDLNKRICVTADSFKALTVDVLKRI